MAEKTNTIKNKIVVEGEKEYKSSLGQLRQTQAELRSEMRATKAEFAGQEESIESLQAQMDILNRQYDTNRRQCETLEEYLEKTARQFGENSKEASDLRIKLNNARAAMNNTGNELSTLRNRLEAVSDAGGEAGEGMAEMSESARRAQSDVRDLADEIEGAMGRKVIDFIVGSRAFDAIADGLKNAITWAIGEGVDGAKERGYLQAGTGDAVLTQSRLDVKDAIDRRWSGRLDGMQTAAAVETVDTTMDNASLTTPGLVEQVANAAIFQQERFGQGIGSQMERADAIVKTFGEDWERAFDLMTLGFQNSHDGGAMMLQMFDQSSQVFKQMGYDADDMFSVILDAVNNSELGKDSNLNKGMLALVNTVTDGGKEAKETLKALGLEASDIGFKAQQGGEAAAAAYQLILNQLMAIEDTDLRNQLGKALFGDNVWTSTGGEIAQALLAGFGQTIEADGTTQAAMDALLDNIGDNMAGTMERAGQAAGSLTEPLIEGLNGGLKEVNRIIDEETDGTITGVLSKFQELSEESDRQENAAINRWFDGLVQGFKEKMQGATQEATETASSATEDMYAQLDAINQQIREADIAGDTVGAAQLMQQRKDLIAEIAKTTAEVESAYDSMGETAATAFEGRSSDFENAANVTSQAAIDAMNAKTTDVQSAGDAMGVAGSMGLEDGLGDGADAGSNYGSAVASGIRSQINTVRLAAMALGNAASSGTKYSMRIASPSKEGLETGENYGSSVATGIGSREREVAAAGEMLGRAADTGVRQAGGFAGESAPAGAPRQSAGADEETIVRAFRRAMNGMAVQFDGMTAGRLLEEGVSVAEYDRAAATISGRSASRRI